MKKDSHHLNPEKGLWKSDKQKLKNVFLDKFLAAGVLHDPKRYLPSFMVAYNPAEQVVKNLSHDVALKKAEKNHHFKS